MNLNNIITKLSAIKQKEKLDKDCFFTILIINFMANTPETKAMINDAIKFIAERFTKALRSSDIVS